MENTDNLNEETLNESDSLSPSPSPREEYRPRKNFFFNDLVSRVGATLIDGLIFLGGLTAINFIASKFNGTLTIGGAVFEYEPHLVIIMKQIALALWFFVSIIMRDTWGYSRSVGKRFCNLKIFTVRAPRPRFYHFFLRNLTVLVPAILLTANMASGAKYPHVNLVNLALFCVILLECFQAFLGFRRIGDYIAGTKVIFFRESNPKYFRGNRQNNYNNGGNGNGGYAPRYRYNNNGGYRYTNRH